MEPLYRAETKCDFDEYKKFCEMGRKRMPLGKWTVEIILVILMVILPSFLIPELFLKNLISIIVISFFMEWAASLIIKKNFDKNKRMKDAVYFYEFYSDYMEMRTENIYQKIRYQDLNAVYETKTNLYIMDIPQTGFIVAKKNCSEELADFLRNCCKENKIRYKVLR